MEGKYGGPTLSRSTRRKGDELSAEYEGSSDDSTESEEEDDEGILASETLDAHIQDTLQAIRGKDPRVYDKNARFFPELEDGVEKFDPDPKQAKPMYLSDYHRRNLLKQDPSAESKEAPPRTYSQQQDELKNSLLKELHTTVNGVNDGGDNVLERDEDVFLVEKRFDDGGSAMSARKSPKLQDLDVKTAEEDPEAYLSKYMSARAWVPTVESRFQPFESDDDEEDQKAEEFEEAYNLRFEDPAKSNEKLMSHARDTAAKYSFRKEETNPRKKAREAEKAKRDAAKQVREQEKARLRKLKIAEAEEKMQKIKDAAGLRGVGLDEHDWSAFMEEGWDDLRWEEEMRKRFGDDYYNECENNGDGGTEISKRKLKKPKWKDDIDITDLVPDFAEDDAAERPSVEPADTFGNHGASSSDQYSRPKQNDSQRHGEEKQKDSRKERRKIESIVDQQMDVDETLSNFGKRHAGQFRYRETSPSAFGLTARDILMASDSQLNQYAGLKKMAAFRDPSKKRKDKKHLGKKARLRQWRKDIFGDEDGSQQSFADLLASQRPDSEGTRDHRVHVDVKDRKGRRNRAKNG